MSGHGAGARQLAYPREVASASGSVAHELSSCHEPYAATSRLGTHLQTSDSIWRRVNGLLR